MACWVAPNSTRPDVQRCYRSISCYGKGSEPFHHAREGRAGTVFLTKKGQGGSTHLDGTKVLLLVVRADWDPPVDLLYYLVDSCLLWSEAAIDRPAASDITGIPMPFTTSIHEQQLAIYKCLHMSAMQYVSCMFRNKTQTLYPARVTKKRNEASLLTYIVCTVCKS